MKFAVIKRKLTSFVRLSPFEHFWLFPTWLLLGLSRATILMFSFRRLAPRLGVSVGVSPWLPILTPNKEKLAARIGRVIRLAARYTPWESNCFPQAVTARILLGLHGVHYAFFFGLMRDKKAGDEMKAHAWVAAGRTCVTGGYSFSTFTVVGCFVAPTLAKHEGVSR